MRYTTWDYADGERFEKGFDTFEEAAGHAENFVGDDKFRGVTIVDNETGDYWTCVAEDDEEADPIDLADEADGNMTPGY